MEEVKTKIEEKQFSTKKYQEELQAIEVDVTKMQNYKNEWFFNINYKRDLECLHENRYNILSGTNLKVIFQSN